MGHCVSCFNVDLTVRGRVAVTCVKTLRLGNRKERWSRLEPTYMCMPQHQPSTLALGPTGSPMVRRAWSTALPSAFSSVVSLLWPLSHYPSEQPFLVADDISLGISGLSGLLVVRVTVSWQFHVLFACTHTNHAALLHSTVHRHWITLGNQFKGRSFWWACTSVEVFACFNLYDL